MGKLNFKPRTIFCRDNLDVLRGINSACIDLIYLDPPFNKNKVFTAARGSDAEGAEFSDIFREEDVKDEWVKSIEYENEDLFSYLSGVKTFGNKYNYCYLAYMAIRLIECRRVLKDTGSVYLHCDPTMSHYLKIVLDCIFGEKNFRNEMVWCYTRMAAKGQRQLSRAHDVIFWYSKADGKKWTFNVDDIRLPYAEGSRKREGMTLNRLGSGYSKEGVTVLNTKGKFPEDWIRHIPYLRQNERTGYPTQKPLALLERIIRASSNKGDMVLDPFCGCATTCVAAEKLGRQWAGVDISVKAYELVKVRIKKELELPLAEREFTFRIKPPKRGREAEAAERGFVYVISHRAYPGEWKVGIAKDPVKRAQSYQTADPRRGYQLEEAFETPYYREVERAVHAHFNADNEWVKAKSVNVVIAAIKRIIAKKGG